MKAWLTSLLYACAAVLALVLSVVSSVMLGSWASSFGSDSPYGSRQSVTLSGKACEQQGALPSERDGTCTIQATLRLRNGSIEMLVGSRGGHRSLNSMLGAQWAPLADMPVVAHDFPDMWRTRFFWPALGGAWLLAGLGAWLAFVFVRRAMHWNAVQEAQSRA